ncbi:helix-turn-helix domain-containing protein [Acinetobacter piscicola]|uniref:helix-turn-helix domain-containing protein n=1 Tax=Acinetobacter piscicola TaxID=2006115 RepID=UPI001022640D|nr:helix-turn-helix domain-containing protein [Acinetobacter piscicola]RYL25171.1 hypothetical protein EWP19_13460 [Acinetobacter piscicola]
MGNQRKPTETWDRYSIKAEIERRGKSLAQLARDNKMSEQAVRNALYMPSKSGEIAISTFLGKPLYILFPERWTKENKRVYPRYSNKECA